MIRRPPRSTLSSSSAASDVYKRQAKSDHYRKQWCDITAQFNTAVSYTHLRAHETPEHLVCRLLLEKKKIKTLTFYSRFSTRYTTYLYRYFNRSYYITNS